ncbi:uncharacterized protein N7498_000539 [Penicillium cinerascens]|uniref:Uncharacterized protein n=1 Tax=Penicillium cinerascens TaxID=70096 RepID=A0A9W9NEJ7_9EURO|nr:uncharacterized protein N7498_000539 [Penicillium cinerascens]KAJ5218440.1 hypothetical protein N7498_000539 [Penicillium cinerascens]
MASATVQVSSGHGSILAQKPTVPVFEKPHHVQTTLNFFKDKSFNKPSISLPVTIHDISGHKLDYSLDRNGFQFYYYESTETDFLDNEKIEREYYPETEKLLKHAPNIRSHHPPRTSRHTQKRSRPASRSVQHVHIDQSYKASENRVSHHLPDEALELLRGRFQIINVSRPICTILKDPLTAADPHTVPDSDLVPVGLIYPDREGETYSVKPDPEIKWYYRYGPMPDLVTLIKCFDSKTVGRARRVPHSAFVNTETEREDGRESIEVRALVFHPGDRE